MKARIVRYGFIGVVAVLIILCGMKFSNMYKDYQKLQFNQEQIDTQVSVLMSMLFSDLYYSDPIELGETKEHADELSVLLQVTSYDEIPHFNDIANKLIEISKNVESRPAFSEQTIELFQSFIYNLGKPLSDDIDTLSTSLYESIMSESVGNRQISRRIKKHLWLSNRSWARDVHSFGILHSWGALAGKSCSAQASSIWLIAGAFRRTQSK